MCDQHRLAAHQSFFAEFAPDVPVVYVFYFRQTLARYVRVYRQPKVVLAHSSEWWRTAAGWYLCGCRGGRQAVGKYRQFVCRRRRDDLSVRRQSLTLFPKSMAWIPAFGTDWYDCPEGIREEPIRDVRLWFWRTGKKCIIKLSVLIHIQPEIRKQFRWHRMYTLHLWRRRQLPYWP